MGRCLACSRSCKEARVTGGERAKKKLQGSKKYGGGIETTGPCITVKTLASTLNEIGSHFQDFWKAAWSHIQQDHSGKMAAAVEAYFWDVSESPCNNRETRMETENPGTTFSSKLGDQVSSQKRSGQKHISKSPKTCMVSASLCHGIRQANLRRSFWKQVTVGPEVRSRGWSTPVPLNFWNCPLQALFLEKKFLGVD